MIPSLIKILYFLNAGILGMRHISMSVSKKSSYVVTLLPGDGIGPEIIAATIPCLNAIAGKNKFSFMFREGAYNSNISNYYYILSI